MPDWWSSTPWRMFSAACLDPVRGAGMVKDIRVQSTKCARGTVPIAWLGADNGGGQGVKADHNLIEKGRRADGKLYWLYLVSRLYFFGFWYKKVVVVSCTPFLRKGYKIQPTKPGK
jgi:hypothetical protein